MWGVFEADFAEIANLPSTTALSLRVFLRSSYNRMPNFILQPRDADDIVAYILSLKRRGCWPAMRASMDRRRGMTAWPNRNGGWALTDPRFITVPPCHLHTPQRGFGPTKG
jgi:hypothetical protein